MRRRDFINSVACGFAAVASTSVSSQGVHAASVPKVQQLDNGVRIHKYQSQLMKGFPPSADQSVTSTSYLTSRTHRVWAQQHMSELCRTQQISRGNGEVRALPRKHQNIDAMLVTGSDGSKVKLIDLLRASHTDAFLVLRDGVIIDEQYFSGMGPDTRHSLWSASKSVSIGVVFNLLQAGKLKESAAVTDYIPELEESGYHGATVRNLMDMQSGVQYDYRDSDLPQSELNLSTTRKEGGCHFRASGFFPLLEGESTDGQYGFLKTLKMSDARAHGSIFYYKCCDTAVLAWACEKVTGKRFADLVSEFVWSKIGAERDGNVVCDVKGACTPYGGMSTTLRDFARWGQVHADNGWWNGQQVIPKESINDVQQKHDPLKVTSDSFLPPERLLPGTAYRSQFWIPGVQRDAFYAWGAYGQLCYVHPQTNSVIVRFATVGGGPNTPNWGRIIPRAFAEVVTSLDA